MSEHPIEIERKFRLDGFRPSMIPDSAVVFDIEQTYLHPIGQTVRRIRKTVGGDGVRYEYTEKWPLNNPDPRKRGELTDEVNEMGYGIFLGKRDPQYATVRKRRFCFTYEGHKWEVDQYHDIPGLWTAEAELKHEDEELLFPHSWPRVVEVTADYEYRNDQIAYRLAQGTASSLVRANS